MSNVFSHLYQLDESISNFRVVGWHFFHFYSNFKRNLCKQTVENCLPMSNKKDAMRIWGKCLSSVDRIVINICTLDNYSRLRCGLFTFFQKSQF